MFSRMFTAVCLATAALALAPAAGAATARSSNPFCARLGHSIVASSGAEMYCFGPQPGGGTPIGGAPVHAAAAGFSANVDAASFAEDVSPSGARGYGQSETSIAAAPPYVVEGFNDATAFFSPCPAPMNKQEGTGWAFSSNGGASFTDEGGLPNAACATHLTEGDPSIEAYTAGGSTYFYIAALYPSVNPSFPTNYISLSACKVTATGIGCGQPLLAAGSTECTDIFGPPTFCSFLDKEYLSIDPAHGRLSISYTEFGFKPATFNGVEDLAVCDLGTPSGAAGPAGGTPGHPICRHGTSTNSPRVSGTPYLTVAPGDANCEQEGSYPAADRASGDVYVGFEYNQATNLFVPPCFSVGTHQVLSRIPASCLILTAMVSPCSGPSASVTQPIVSMDAAFIPGYNRFPGNDFPRVAVDSAAGTVSMVWNDAGANPLGDILLRSWTLGTLHPVQSAPVRLNSSPVGLHFLPAVRNASAGGKLAVSWFDRATPTTTLTDLRADLSLDPRLTATPASGALVTTASSDWNGVSSDIVPNFGDYTDNYAAAGKVFMAWSDGRTGVPQPFEASAAMP